MDYSHPQEPKPPFPYTSEDVVYKNAKQGNTLAGTITKPAGAGPFPTVILITGSGAQDRNESLLGHKPFLVIADYLTRRGIEVLRVDDRGIGGSSGSTPNSTTADFVTDVEAGIELLKGRPEVDKRHIGLIGHSEGGIIAPMVASESSDVAFIVMLAGTAIRGDKILRSQAEALIRIDHIPGPEAAAMLDTQAKLIHVLETEPDQEKARAEVADITQHDASSGKKMTPAMAGAVARSYVNPWFRYFVSLDPVPYLEKVHCPVLALDGTKDMQVVAKDNLPLIRATLERGGNRNVTTREMKGLNHLFQHAKSGGPEEYGSIKETFSPEVLKIMGDWILGVSGERGSNRAR
jgi:pimeloyl-ACP methyl ester carboxylesterase